MTDDDRAAKEWVRNHYAERRAVFGQAIKAAVAIRKAKGHALNPRIVAARKSGANI